MNFNIEQLTLEQKYTKSDFGISGIEYMWSEITVQGEPFIFFAFDSKYNNALENDGFIYEGRGEYALIPHNKTSEIHRHVFFRKKKGEGYTYLGKGLYETRYDEKRNKIFLNNNGGAGRKEILK